MGERVYATKNFHLVFENITRPNNKMYQKWLIAHAIIQIKNEWGNFLLNKMDSYMNSLSLSLNTPKNGNADLIKTVMSQM